MPKIARIALIAAVVYLLVFGIAQAFFPIRPFWNDEWRLIYNIKFKNFAQLWGTLDLLQECPRAYLSLLKIIGAYFDYSYTALRLPPLFTGICSIALLFSLHKKLYPGRSVTSYLFILILISSQTFTDYLVQVKQYEMDIFLALAALWQLVILLNVSAHEQRRRTYSFLCLSLLIVPYFSYTYPIATAPLFPLALVYFWVEKRKILRVERRSFFMKLCLPLLLLGASIFVFYEIDVKNMMADERMYASYQRAYYHSEEETFIKSFWHLFALIGSGFVFELVWGVLGIAAFFYNVYDLARTKIFTYKRMHYFRLYAIMLIVVILVLFAAGKLIGGVARLTAYSVPAISILIIAFLEDVKQRFHYVRATNMATTVLFIALLGNIVTTCINTFTYPEYKSRITTYRNTARALEQARKANIPFMATDGVCGDQWDINPPAPGKIQTNTITPAQIAGVDTLCAEVIVKVNPAYKVWDTVPFFYMPDAKWMNEYVQQLPSKYTSVIAGNGIHYKKYIRE